jgi:hypothetical protein
MRHVIWNPTLNGVNIQTYAELLKYEKEEGSSMSTEVNDFTEGQIKQWIHVCEQETNITLYYKHINENKFKAEIYEIAFGWEAIDKGYTDKEVITRIRECSNNEGLFQDIKDIIGC